MNVRKAKKIASGYKKRIQSFGPKTPIEEFMFEIEGYMEGYY
jgi:hypothetical protein